jgi:fatty-acyl-CoA synthase
VPERWALVSEIPKTSVGKYDKKVLRAMYADGKLPTVELTTARDRR